MLGEELSIYCDEELITSPTIQQVLTSGDFSIGGEYSLKEAKSLVDTIKLSME
ncbi:SecDF P1 head subdomain-containing protein [Mannheimia haemolytica]|uniref:SecDF P1 head subdomain-containing protein n=1 Tax=Mannheimia haemolytica TaxID=75985 RepID=UPI003B52011E